MRYEYLHNLVENGAVAQTNMHLYYELNKSIQTIMRKHGRVKT